MGDDREIESEEKVKERVFDSIDKAISDLVCLIDKIMYNARYIRLKPDLPNMGITLNNKMIEIQKEFNNAGISMYSRIIKEDTFQRQSQMTESLVGYAIMSDLENYVEEGIKCLDQCNYTIEKALTSTDKRKEELEGASTITRLIEKIKKFLGYIEDPDIPYTEEERAKANEYLAKYVDLDKKLWKYNLKDNVVSSIVQYIAPRYSPLAAPNLIKQCVMPDLEKLGLTKLLPEIRKSIMDAYDQKVKRDIEVAIETERILRIQVMSEQAKQNNETRWSGTINNPEDDQR